MLRDMCIEEKSCVAMTILNRSRVAGCNSALAVHKQKKSGVVVAPRGYRATI